MGFSIFFNLNPYFLANLQSTVGNAKACELGIVDELEVEEKDNLSAIFPIDTTMQDGGKRKRSVVIRTTDCRPYTY